MRAIGHVRGCRRGRILKTIFVGPTGVLANTVFCILAPDGKTKLSRSGRSPSFVFHGEPDVAADEMAATMNQIARRYPRKDVPQVLPLLADVRLALNVAAADHQPLVVLVAPNAEQLQAVESKLTQFAWSDEFVGYFQYVSTRYENELQDIAGVRSGQA